MPGIEIIRDNREGSGTESKSPDSRINGMSTLKESPNSGEENYTMGSSKDKSLETNRKFFNNSCEDTSGTETNNTRERGNIKGEEENRPKASGGNEHDREVSKRKTSSTGGGRTAGLSQQNRKSSFGLGFLSAITNTFRSQSSNASFEVPNTFMSNSPTIANLSNYNLQEPRSILLNENLPSNGGQITEAGTFESSNSDFEQTEVNNVNTTNDEGLTNQRNQLASEESVQSGISNEAVRGTDKDGFYSVRLTPLIDYSSSISGLYFSPVIRKIKPENTLSIGRYTERNKGAAHAPQGSSAPIVFKSKVVSRSHALLHCNEEGQWFLKDCKSSSGTFLNHIRLSLASRELAMTPVADGDIIQLGMDYRGGTEEVYRCVKMKCEFNRSWQRKVRQFNIDIHKKLKGLAITNESGVQSPLGDGANGQDLSECAICLLGLEPCQALFISPCSHCWHFKCIRPIIMKSYPQFYCPNCRSICDLESDIEEDE